MFKNKINSYFFIEFFKTFLLVLVSLSLLIWITQAAKYLELITELGNSIKVYFHFILFLFPKTVLGALPLSFVVSMFFFLSKLQSDNELNIFFLSGISKKEIIIKNLTIGFFVYIFYIFLSVYFTPLSSLKAREALNKSKFTLINALVKSQNFNSPLKGLTIYVEKNDNNGKLDNVFIYEKDRTIIARKGTVFSDGNQSILELIDGVTMEKVNQKINYITFSKTIFDFSKYNSFNITYPKFSERSIFWIIDEMKKENPYRIKDLREELNKRTIKPFLIFLLSVCGCFLLCYKENEKNLNKFRIKIYLITFLILIFNEILLSISAKSQYFIYYYSLSLFMIFLILTASLFFKINNEYKQN